MRFILFSLLIVSGFTTHSQKSVKDGIDAFSQGNYDDAVLILSNAMREPSALKAKDRLDGWYYLGKSKMVLISNAMSLQSQDVFGKYKGYDLDAFHCYKQALAEEGSKRLESDIIEDIKSLGYVLFNSGNSQYLLGESAFALTYYNSAAEIAEKYGMDSDYQIYNLRGQTLVAAGDSVKAYEDFTNAIDRYKASKPEIPDANIGYAYYIQAVIERYSKGNLDRALERIQSGTEFLDLEADRLNKLLSDPGDQDLRFLAAQETQFMNIRDVLSRFELDIYRASPEKLDEAIAKFDKALKDNPNDENMWLIYGNLVEQKDLDAGYEAYKKAIEINPESDMAYFNAGANRVNKGADFARKANDETDFQKAMKWEDKVDEQFNLALPHLRKAHELDPDNIYILDALLQVTIKLELMDEYKEYKEKQNKLKGY